MTLQQILDARVVDGTVPGAVALVSAPDGTDEVALAGHRDLARTAPMTRDTVFRLASVTKPFVAALVLTLVDEGRLALDDAVGRWLPEIADPVVVRAPDSSVADVVPARRPITVADLLTMRAGWGWPPEGGLPAVDLLNERAELTGEPHDPRPPERWLADLAGVPLLAQPGERWLYNTCSDLQGVLVARVLGQDLPDAFAERIAGPLGLVDTGFSVAPDRLEQVPELVRGGVGVLSVLEGRDPAWARPPTLASGSCGLVSTLDDLTRFLRVLAAGGTLNGVRVLAEPSVRAMTTDRLTGAQRAAAGFYLDGQGWGYGGSVDVAPGGPAVVPGRYGWVGGSGTAAYVVPATGAITVLLAQRAIFGPEDGVLIDEVCAYAAGRGSQVDQ